MFESLPYIITKGIIQGGGKGLPPTTHVSPRGADGHAPSSVPAVDSLPHPRRQWPGHRSSAPAADAAGAQSGSGIRPGRLSRAPRSWDRTELSRLCSQHSFRALYRAGVGRGGRRGQPLPVALAPTLPLTSPKRPLPPPPPNGKRQALARVWGNGSPCARMVGCEVVRDGVTSGP